MATKEFQPTRIHEAEPSSMDDSPDLRPVTLAELQAKSLERAKWRLGFGRNVVRRVFEVGKDDVQEQRE